MVHHTKHGGGNVKLGQQQEQQQQELQQHQFVENQGFSVHSPSSGSVNKAVAAIDSSKTRGGGGCFHGT